MTTTSPYFDLQGALTAQKNLIMELSGGITDFTTLGNIRNSYVQLGQDMSNSIAPFILTKYDQINNIVTTETDRVNRKQQSVQQLVDSQKRLISLNNNYIERTKIYVKVVIFLVLIVLLLIILRRVGVSETIFTITAAICISAFFIYCLNQYYLLSSRDNLDFNSLNNPAPNVLNSSQVQQKVLDARSKTSQGGNIFSSIDLGQCIGSNCCSTDTVWDVSSQMCIRESFTPSEFDSYSRY